MALALGEHMALHPDPEKTQPCLHPPKAPSHCGWLTRTEHQAKLHGLGSGVAGLAGAQLGHEQEPCSLRKRMVHWSLPSGPSDLKWI